MISKHSHVPPSVYMGITDDLTAFELNSACSWLYFEFENKREAERLKVQLQGIACLLGAKPDDFAGESEDAEIW